MPKIVPGLPYFSLDVNLNKAVELLELEYGLKGFAAYIHLLQMIYKDRGYYTQWDKDVELKFADDIHASVGFVSEIIRACLRRGIFDNDMYIKYGVLTSIEIQENYFNAVKRRKKVKVIDEILLIELYPNGNEIDIIRDNAGIKELNANINTQRRGEDSRVYISDSDDNKAHRKIKNQVNVQNVQNYVENSDNEEEYSDEPFDKLSDSSATLLTQRTGELIYKYWSRRVQPYDVNQAAGVLRLLFIKNKIPFKELTADHIELIEEALMIAADADAKKWSYVKGIFRKWAKAKIFTYDDYVKYSLRNGS